MPAGIIIIPALKAAYFRRSLEGVTFIQIVYQYHFYTSQTESYNRLINFDSNLVSIGK